MKDLLLIKARMATCFKNGACNPDKRGFAMFNCLMMLFALVALARSQQLGDTIKYSVQEELQADTVFGNVARDSSLGSRYNATILQILRYSLLPQPNQEDELFYVEETTGLLRTSVQIDRDEICPGLASCYRLLSVAISPPQYFEIISFKVEIVDINDNQPVFSTPEIVVHILESAGSGPEGGVSLPVPKDPDSPTFGVIEYELEDEGASIFAVDAQETLDGSTDVRLICTSALDREIKDFYQVTVVAYDGGSPRKSGTLLIDINVDDANDNHPEFEDDVYEVTIAENQGPDSFVVTVKATDLDLGPNAEIEYGFSGRTMASYSDLFDIHAASGEIYLKKAVDYDRQHIYRLVVTAQDKGPGSRTSMATVVVRLRDVNDNPPQITINTLTPSGAAEIAETSHAGTFVAHVQVTDSDHGPSGDVQCQMENFGFRLQKMYDKQYKVVTNIVFDREDKESYQVQIECQDLGTPPLKADRNLTIYVRDVNDNPPQFLDGPYIARVPENNAPGTFVIQVNATDHDVGGNAAIYFGLAGDAAALFTIDEQSGVITAESSLDYESLPQARLLVTARDAGIPRLSATTTVTVLVLDENDEVPRFIQQIYSFGVFENRLSGEEVGIVNALDEDAPPNDQVEYTLESDDPWVPKVFEIGKSSGKITTKMSLDREATAAYYLKVLAQNPGISSPRASADVTIYVADENDNAPVFDFPTEKNNTVRLSSQVPVGYVVTRIVAHDSDIGDNGHFSFDIIFGNSEHVFELDKATGAITVHGNLGSLRTQVFNFTVEVRDMGSPSMTDTANLCILLDNSIPFQGSGTSLSRGLPRSTSRLNALIIIAVGCIAGFIIVALIVAIVAIHCQNYKHKQLQRHSSRIEAQKMSCGRYYPPTGGAPPSNNAFYPDNMAFTVCSREMNHLASTKDREPCKRTSSFVSSNSLRSGQHLNCAVSDNGPASRESWTVPTQPDLIQQPNFSSSNSLSQPEKAPCVCSQHTLNIPLSKRGFFPRQPCPLHSTFGSHHCGTGSRGGRQPHLEPLDENAIQVKCLNWPKDVDVQSDHSGDVSNADSGQGPSEEGDRNSLPTRAWTGIIGANIPTSCSHPFVLRSSQDRDVDRDDDGDSSGVPVINPGPDIILTPTTDEQFDYPPVSSTPMRTFKPQARTPSFIPIQNLTGRRSGNGNPNCCDVSSPRCCDSSTSQNNLDLPASLAGTTVTGAGRGKTKKTPPPVAARTSSARPTSCDTEPSDDCSSSSGSYDIDPEDSQATTAENDPATRQDITVYE